MRRKTPAELSAQLSQACAAIERHLESSLLGVYLYGSSVMGGLKPFSDIDLLAAVAERPDETVRRALSLDLLEASAPPGRSRKLRPLEVTVVVQHDVVPWRYPPRRELQFGEWLRGGILAGDIEPARFDPDLAVLLAKARNRSFALIGPPAAELFDPVPKSHLFKAFADILKLWNAPSDWAGDEVNVALTLARIWYSAATGDIASKEEAAGWALERLPAQLKSALAEARQAYLGIGEDRLRSQPERLAPFARFVKSEAGRLIDEGLRGG